MSDSICFGNGHRVLYLLFPSLTLRSFSGPCGSRPYGTSERGYVELNHTGARYRGRCAEEDIGKDVVDPDERSVALEAIALPAEAKYDRVVTRPTTLELELTTWAGDRRKLLERDIGRAPYGQKDGGRDASTRHEIPEDGLHHRLKGTISSESFAATGLYVPISHDDVTVLW